MDASSIQVLVEDLQETASSILSPERSSGVPSMGLDQTAEAVAFPDDKSVNLLASISSKGSRLFGVVSPGLVESHYAKALI